LIIAKFSIRCRNGGHRVFCATQIVRGNVVEIFRNAAGDRRTVLKTVIIVEMTTSHAITVLPQPCLHFLIDRYASFGYVPRRLCCSGSFSAIQSVTLGSVTRWLQPNSC
uniref:Secreted protein n=1 Tax=Haemonchus placei TaxID=6290 RepID=A0A158QR69_HAEPC